MLLALRGRALSVGRRAPLARPLARRLCSAGVEWSKREAAARTGGMWSTNGVAVEASAPKGLVGWCTRALSEYPLRANAVVAGTLGAAGDAAAQLCEYYLDIMSPGKSKYNWQRTRNMAVFGVVAGPVFSMWYRGLDKAAKAVAVRYEARLALKIAADNMLAAPMMLHLYYWLMGTLEGRGPQEIMDNARSSFYKAWALGVSVWIPVQFFNFHAMPLYLQPVVIATFDVGYKMSLSLLNHRAAYGTGQDALGGAKAAPALQFEWPSPTNKLHMTQLANAELQQVIVTQQARIGELEKEIIALRSSSR